MTAPLINPVLRKLSAPGFETQKIYVPKSGTDKLTENLTATKYDLSQGKSKYLLAATTPTDASQKI